jgi:class 3 adenylate cyclase
LDDVGQWLTELGLPQYIERFAAHDIDASVLRDLADADLKELGMSLGHRRKLLRAVAALSPNRELPEHGMAIRDTAGRRHLTVMFCDLAGSTALSTQLDPEDLREVILAYQHSCTEVIRAYDGFLAKYLGDGILVYFGYPQAREDDAERAVRAGLAIVAAVTKLSAEAGIVPPVRIGIATGPVVVGDLIGEGVAQERQVVGEAPNLAARLQGVAPLNGVVIAPATLQLLGNLFRLTDLGLHELKGFGEKTRAWQVDGEAAVPTRFAAKHASGLAAFVGREPEAALLLRRKEQAWAAGAGQVILISGEAGVGKSRLLAWLAEQVADEPHILLRYQCSAYHADSPLHPFIQQLRFVAGIEPGQTPAEQCDRLEAALAPTATAFERAVPLLARLLSIPAEERYRPIEGNAAQQRQATLAALLGQLEAAASRQKVLALFEDLHWCDATSLDLLMLVVERIAALPVLLIATARPEFEAPWRHRSNAALQRLDRLGPDQAHQMIRWLTGGKDLSPALLAQMLAKTDGVPLFIEELTKTVLESGQLVELDGLYHLAGAPADLAIPASLQDSLMARLDRLPAARGVAETAAVIGRSFSHRMLAALSDLDRASLDRALAALVDAQLIHRRGDGPEAQYSFKHALVQDAAYESLLRTDRQKLHARAIDVIETQFPDLVETEPELLAFHAARALLIEKAVQYWLAAAQRSRHHSHLAETAAQLRAALALLETLPATIERDRQELLCQSLLAPALVHAKGYGTSETMAAWRRAQSLAAAIGTPEQRFSSAYGLCVGQYAQGELAATFVLAGECLRVAEAVRDRTQLCVAERLIAVAHFLAGDFDQVVAHSDRAMSYYDPVEHPRLANDLVTDFLVNALCYKAMALSSLGYAEQARAAIADVTSHAERLDHAPSQVLALWHAGIMTGLILRDDTLTAASATACASLAAEHGLSWWLYGCRAVLAWLEARRSGDPAAASAIERERRVMGELRSLVYSTMFLAFHAEALALSGDVAGGLTVLEEGISSAEAAGHGFWLVELYRLRGVLRRQSKPARDGAEPALRQAVALARQQQAVTWELRAGLDLAALLIEAERGEEGYVLLRGIYRRLTEGYDTIDATAARALLAGY